MCTRIIPALIILLGLVLLIYSMELTNNQRFDYRNTYVVEGLIIGILVGVLFSGIMKEHRELVIAICMLGFEIKGLTLKKELKSLH